MTPAATPTHGSRTVAHGAAGKPAAGENTAPGGAFSALMSVLGESDVPLLPADSSPDAPAASVSSPLADAPMDMACLLAQSGLAGSALAATDPATDYPAAAAGLAALAEASASQAPTALPPPSGLPPAGGTHRAQPGAVPDGKPLAAAAAAAQSALNEPPPAALKLAELAHSQAASGNTAPTHAGHATLAQDLQAQAQRTVAAQQESRLLQPLDLALTQASPQADLQGLRDLLAGSAPVGAARSERRSSERGNAGTEGLMAGQPAGQSTPTYSVTPSAPLPEGQQFSEQVRYWIANDIQNAHMQLDGLGEKPVEVSISLHGNQAHVAFRSDELQARSVLEAAGSQLRDMLQREGVVLAGVSVGTSQMGQAGQGAGQGAGEGQRRPRAGQRPVQGVASVAAPAQARRSATAAGRSVDLFV